MTADMDGRIRVVRFETGETTDAEFQGQLLGMAPTLACNDGTIITTANNKLVSSSMVFTIFLVTQGVIELGDTVV